MSSFVSIPANSSHSWRHNVFVSFWDLDTRNTFVDHLFAALDQQRITYLNNETLPRGVSIEPLVLKVIEVSQIVIIVFSKNYTRSRWCLNQLAYIMKCKEERQQLVIPIFYDVDRLEVQKQEGVCREPFARYEVKYKDKVGSWRKALVCATQLQGWDIYNRHEAKCIQEIVGAISERLYPNKVLTRTRSSFQHLKDSVDASSSHQSKDHDVFISCRAVDTRMNFVDHLYTAFEQQGIHAYKEDEETLANRISVGPTHWKAIEQSRISVIVFSKNYANSSVCLDDLAYIMKCMSERGQVVLPIFYDVDPWLVGRRLWKSGEAFAQIELKNKNRVETWRKALSDASDISGWLPKFTANGRESKCVKEIVDTVSNRLFPYKALRPDVEHLKISLEVILMATNTFAKENIIAGGGFGKVYLGQSKQHGTVAIKQLDRKNGQGDHEFMMEIALLSTYKHDKVVSLVGFCDKEGEKILVYKYESNGSLDKHLFSKDLTWIQRLRICLDVAHGLKYIHDDVGHHHRILHRDVKSSNILLDENWNAKISDFGLSKIALANVPLSVLISNPCGTLGYIDPQYKDNNILTQKCDVYSFGVVLFEVLCGKLVTDAKPLDDRHFSVKSVKTHYLEDTLDEVIDVDLRNQMDPESLSTFSKIAYYCLKEFGEERPTMSKVVKKLKKALDHQLVVAAA